MPDDDVDLAAGGVPQAFGQTEAEKKQKAMASEVTAPPVPLSTAAELAPPSRGSSSPDDLVAVGPAEPRAASGSDIVSEGQVPLGPVVGLETIPAEKEARAAEETTGQKKSTPLDDAETATVAGGDGQPAVTTTVGDAVDRAAMTRPSVDAEPQVAKPSSEPQSSTFGVKPPTVGESTPAAAETGIVRKLPEKTRAASPMATESDDSTGIVTRVPAPELPTEGEALSVSVAGGTRVIDETDSLDQQFGSRLKPPHHPDVATESAKPAVASFAEAPDLSKPDDSATAEVVTRTAEERSPTLADPVEAFASASSLEAIEPGAGPDVADIELPLEVSKVLFNHGSSYLSPGAVLMVDRAAAMLAKLPGSYLVEIIGFTDTVGPVEFNVWLAERRVRRVIDALVRRGVPNETLIAVPKGPFDLPVPTGPNVSEPINRAVAVQVSGPS
jgi:outer membrane protein OmpA-like peptidoglycan-associated protein